MNKNFTYCFLLFAALLVENKHLSAQVDLVPNYSFEVFTTCPTGFNQISYAYPWSGSPDYYNACNTAGFGVPNNGSGSQFARTGIAYAGIHTYVPGFTDSREYLQVELLSKLVAGTNYCVEFYVSLADTVRLGTNNMGAYFSDTAIYSTTGQVLNVVPQISNDISLNPLISDTEWIKISGSFVANGTEKFITIGNFNDDITSDTTHFSGGSYFDAYYYVDDVSVFCCDCHNFIPNVFSPNNDGQNDFVDFSSIDLVEEIVDIYNRWGNIVFQSSVNNKKWDGKDQNGNDCTEGVYYYVFHYAEFINNTMDKKGFIQLVR